MLRRPLLPRPVLCLALTALMASGLSACFPRPDYRDLPDASVIQLKAESQELVIANILAPTLLEKSRVQTVLSMAPTGTRVRIRLPQGRPPSEDQLRQAISDLGIPTGIAALSGQPSPDQRTVLVIYHLTAVAPDCASMVTPSEAIQKTPFASEKRPTMAFGCATYSNLAAMVADPADLAAGRSLNGQDAADAAAAVDRYHDDKVKALRETTAASGSKPN